MDLLLTGIATDGQAQEVLTLIPNKEQMEIVHRIFEKYAEEDASPQKCCRYAESGENPLCSAQYVDNVSAPGFSYACLCQCGCSGASILCLTRRKGRV